MELAAIFIPSLTDGDRGIGEGISGPVSLREGDAAAEKLPRLEYIVSERARMKQAWSPVRNQSLLAMFI